MRKTLLVTALMSALVLPVAAQTKLDAGSRARLRQMSVNGQTFERLQTADDMTIKAVPVTSVSQSDPKAGVFVTLAPGYTFDALAAEGFVREGGRGNIVLLRATPDEIEQLEQLEAVASIRLEKPVELKMDRVRALSGIDRMHAGEGLPQPYTGRGVVAGIVDGGFDPNHVNFKNEDGTSRIGFFNYYRPTQDGKYVPDVVYRDRISEVDTETSEAFHGTHTLGIMAGGYKGKIQVAESDGGFSAALSEQDCPYYGVATGAEIAVACGNLTDYYIALGIDAILDYAYYEYDQAPAVINLSLGSNIGPHDGSSILCQFLDYASVQDKVVFCVSAGNEGDLPIALTKDFTAEDNTLKSCLAPMASIPGYQNAQFGTPYIYSDTSEPFEIQAVIINKKRNAVAMRMPLEASPEGAEKYWASSADFAGSDEEVSAQFARYFNGYVGVIGMLDQDSGRYMAVIDYTVWDNTAGSNALGNYVLGFEITGKAGQRIHAYGDGQLSCFSSYGLDGYANGTTNGTISDVATARNIIVVGSYNQRDEWGAVDGLTYGYEGKFPGNGMSSFTSYGTLVDGRNLPHICAPGATVISSYNEHYLLDTKNGFTTEDERNMSRNAVVNDGDRNHSFFQCLGTSMSAPVVSGTVACWLEADPTLTYSDVRDILERTAVVDDDVRTSGDPVQWGAGKLDAYAGIKEVLRRASVDGILSDNGRTMVRELGGNRFEIFQAGTAVSATAYNMAGVPVMSASAPGDTLTLDASALPAGIYIINVNGTHSQRIIIR